MNKFVGAIALALIFLVAGASAANTFTGTVTQTANNNVGMYVTQTGSNGFTMFGDANTLKQEVIQDASNNDGDLGLDGIPVAFSTITQKAVNNAFMNHYGSGAMSATQYSKQLANDNWFAGAVQDNLNMLTLSTNDYDASINQIGEQKANVNVFSLVDQKNTNDASIVKSGHTTYTVGDSIIQKSYQNAIDNWVSVISQSNENLGAIKAGDDFYIYEQNDQNAITNGYGPSWTSITQKSKNDATFDVDKEVYALIELRDSQEANNNDLAWPDGGSVITQTSDNFAKVVNAPNTVKENVVQVADWNLGSKVTQTGSNKDTVSGKNNNLDDKVYQEANYNVLTSVTQKADNEKFVSGRDNQLTELAEQYANSNSNSIVKQTAKNTAFVWVNLQTISEKSQQQASSNRWSMVTQDSTNSLFAGNPNPLTFSKVNFQQANSNLASIISQIATNDAETVE